MIFPKAAHLISMPKVLRFSAARENEPVPNGKVRGAYLIETAVVMPLVLALLLSIFWFSTLLNTYIGLRWAVGEGLRLAVTRGDYRRVGTRVIPALNGASYKYTGLDPTQPFMPNWGATGMSDASPDGEKLRRLFIFNLRQWPEDPPPPAAGAYAMNFYGTKSFKVFTAANVDPRWMPPPLIYSIAYVGETMKYTSGREVSYPCDPAGTATNDGPGCLKCRFLNPVTLGDEPYTGVFPQGMLPFSRMALECEYGLSLTFLGPVYRLLSLVTGQAYTDPIIVVRSRKHTDVETATAWEAL